MSRPTAGLILVVILLSHIAACGGKTPIQPPPPAAQLALTCPSEVIREATSSEGTEVHFDTPNVSGGVPPHSIQCDPGSGSIFPIGDSVVRCTASDVDGAQAACDLTVKVRVSQRLARTRFLAFGDSITAGVIRLAPLIMLGLPDAYPAQLEQLLRNRYPTQDIVVLNFGRGGETASQGVARLPGVLDAERPEVLLLLEGVNNISRLSPSSVARDLRTMVSIARQREIDVMIATLTPVRRPYTNSRPTAEDAVRNVNARILEIAAEFGLGSPVDLFGAFEADRSLLGSDGLHPTIEGYRRIAEIFNEEIVRRYDERPQSLRWR
jgi:lysophospholipase L1-like esterase